MELLGKIHKSGKNSHQGWSYPKIDDVKNGFRPVLVESGVSFKIDISRWQILESIKSLAFDFVITLTNADNADDKEETRTTVIISTISDTAVGKAQSYAEKNFLLATFLIGGSDDLESDVKDVPIKIQAAKTPARPAAPAAKNVDKLIDELYECESLNELRNVWRTLGKNISSEVWDKALPVYKKLQRTLS